MYQARRILSRMNFDTGLIDRLRAARRVAVFTGAGVSAESGVPTFRDAQTGLWARFRPEELATPEAFRRDPVTVWNWYAWRRELVASVQPNPAHLAIAELQQRVEALTVITQNVDGLHQQAGSRDVVELHGNIWIDLCFECGRRAGPSPASADVPPRCAHCNGLLRPGVVWFGESLPSAAWSRALECAQGAEVFFCIGTSSLVEPAASLPHAARAAGAMLVQVNPVPTGHDAIAHHVLRGKAGVILPTLLEALDRM